MKIGIQIPNFTYPGGDAVIGSKLKEIVQTVDQGGFSSLWVMDHFYQIQDLFGLDRDQAMLEGYSALNYFAGLTENVTLGTLVSGVIYRNPAFLIKQVTTLDVLSQGRAYFGIGAGWYKEEAEGYGFPFPATKVRFEMLEETLQIAHAMWSDKDDAYLGTHYTQGSTLNSPEPISKPHPKIMIGGMGEKKTLRMVAQYADTTNLFAGAGIDVLKHKLQVLQGHCNNLNRDYDEIEKTTLGTINLMPNEQTPQDIINYFRDLAEIGIDHAIVNLPNIYEIKPLETLRDEILPEIRDL
ncbi:MAG: LLM class F420-dependent oxidoreductase [Candidatus Heimdallarchaeota archaeon]|nr:LLM class F420-dependent oxidoreductase [Candidatus Heimdallarchaeota archaeon]